MAGAVLRSRVEMLNAIVGPIVGTVAGGEWKGHSASGGRKEPRASTSDPHHRKFRMSDYDTPEAKESALINALGGRFRTVSSSTPAAPDGA